MTQEQVNMAEKKEVGELSKVPLKMNDPGEFDITYTIGGGGGVKIPHDLYDLGLSFNVMPLSKFKKLEICEIVRSNMTLTLTDSSMTHPLNIVQDVIIHVDGLTFPANFVVIEIKNDLEGSVILKGPFLTTG